MNASVAVSGTKDLTPELFPALAAMQPPPAEVPLRDASLMTSADPSWDRWSGWAKSAPQQAVIQAIKKVTDPKGKYAFSLKYGADGAESAWVKAGLFVDLGKPPLLALAPGGLNYIKRLDQVMLLTTIEAERLASEGKPQECMELLLARVRLARSVADRAFASEKAWAYTQMIAALERLRDVAALHPGLFKPEQCKLAVDDLELRAMAPERIRFPSGEKAAISELMSLTMDERGGPKAAAFAATMARVTGSGRAVNLFAQAGYWARVQAAHAGWFDTRDQLAKVYGDWEKRWELNNIFDPYMDAPTDWTKTDAAKFAIIVRLSQGIERLFDLRAVLDAELAGTRTAIAVVGYRSQMETWPPTLPAVQPRFVGRLDHDPWFFEPYRSVRQDFRFFVPIRDEKFEEREAPMPRIVHVNMGVGSPAPVASGPATPAPATPPAGGSTPQPSGGGLGAAPDEQPATPPPAPPTGAAPPAGAATAASEPRVVPPAAYPGPAFEIGLTESDFVLYSVGPDGKGDFAEWVGVGGNDILIWPPIITLERRAKEKGLIKSGAGGVGDAFGLRMLNVHLLADIAPKVFDKASGNVDTNKLRELWTAAAEREVSAQVADPSAMASIKAAVAMSSTLEPAQVLQGIEAMFKMPEVRGVIERDAQAYGLSPQEVEQFLLKANERLLSSDGANGLRAKVKGGGELTAQDLTDATSEGIEILSGPEFQGVLKKILAHLSGPGAGPAQGAGK